MKAVEQYFPVVLFIMLYKEVITFVFVDGILQSGGPLRPGEIVNTWQYDEKSKSFIFHPEIPMVILETWWDFFPKIFF